MLAYHQIATEHKGKARQKLLCAEAGKQAGWTFRSPRKRTRAPVIPKQVHAHLMGIDGNTDEGVNAVMEWMNG